MRSASDADVLYGRNPVRLFLEKSPRRVTRVWIDRRLNAQLIDKYSRLSRGRSAQITLVDPGQIDRITGGAVHQGVAVEAEPLKLRNFSDLFGRLKSRRTADAETGRRILPGLLALDNLTDPQNFGAICRTAEAFGIEGVLFELKHAPPLGGAAYKASAGAIDFVPLYPVNSLPESIRTLKNKGVSWFGLDAGSKEPLNKCPVDSQKLALGLILGSEGSGMRPQIRSMCDQICSIPMKGRVGSLNVSAAAAAACFWWSTRE